MPLLAVSSCNAMLKQILHENKFLSPPFTGRNKEAQSSKWLSKPECGRSVQEATSILGALDTRLDTMDPTEQKPSHRFTPAVM